MPTNTIETDETTIPEGAEMPTYADICRRAAMLMRERGEWAGCPVPVSGYKLSIESRNPYHGLAESLEETPDPDAAQSGKQEDVSDEPIYPVAYFHSRRRNCNALLYRKGDENGRAGVMTFPVTDAQRRLDLLAQSIGASVVYPLDAEFRAQEELSRYIDPHKFRYYLLTGMFMETSRRSGVMYIFRRCRPTLALRNTAEGAQGLAALCLHPIAYYEKTFAGSMVPTDEVIAHLLLMRGDEHLYWRRANQHPLDTPEAGL